MKIEITLVVLLFAGLVGQVVAENKNFDIAFGLLQLVALLWMLGIIASDYIRRKYNEKNG